MRVEFVRSHTEASNIITYFFKPEKRVNYTAGQFAEWTLPHIKPDHRGIKRWFTISSSPTEELVSFTTKFSSDKSSSFKKALRKLVPGDELSMSAPMGDFVLPKLIQTPLIFVAGGIGITPFHSMLAWLSATKERRPIKMLYAVNNEDEIIFLQNIDATKQHVTVVVNKPSSSWGGERGRINANLVLGIEKPTDDTLIYVSGPEPMVETLENELKKTGIKNNQFVGDYFPNYPNY